MDGKSYDIAPNDFTVKERGEVIISYQDQRLKIKKESFSKKYSVEAELELTGLRGQARPIRFKEVKYLEPL